MARPKSTAPIKGRLNITVSPNTRQQLTDIATASGCSISQLIANWAAAETIKLNISPQQPD